MSGIMSNMEPLSYLLSSHGERRDWRVRRSMVRHSLIR